MSYSRWSNSYWYTFWACRPDDAKETRDNAIFEICGVAMFEAQQLRKDLDLCLEIVEKSIEMELTDKLKEELKEYINDFLEDVEHEYAP